MDTLDCFFTARRSGYDCEIYFTINCVIDPIVLPNVPIFRPR